MLPLFPDEQIVTQSNEGSIILTTHRICLEKREWGRSYNQNIMLEHVTSCENRYNTQVWLLVVAVICLLAGLVSASSGNTQAFGVGALAAVILAVFYWVTRKNAVIIASPSTKMFINVTGMGRQRVLDFINKVEQTKHKRIVNLNNKPNIIS